MDLTDHLRKIGSVRSDAKKKAARKRYEKRLAEGRGMKGGRKKRDSYTSTPSG